MKTKFFSLVCIAVLATTATAQRISSFTLEGKTNLGPFAAFNPKNNDESQAGDLQIVFTPETDLTNATANIVCGAGAEVVTTLPTDFSKVINIKLTDTVTQTNAWYNITCKKIIPETLPYTLAADFSNESWTNTTTGWAAACIQKSQTNPRFGNANANLLIAFTDAPDSIFFSINASTADIPAGNIFDVDESADGTTWTHVVRYDDSNLLPNSQAIPADKAQKFKLLETSRYVRWLYTNRAAKANVSLTNEIKITKKDNTANRSTKFNQQVTLYPIPASDILNISTEKTIAEINICNLSGQVIQSEQTANKFIRIADIPAGIYQAVITLTDGTKAVKTFSKQ